MVESSHQRKYQNKNCLLISEIGYYDDLNKKCREQMEDQYFFHDDILKDKSCSLYGVLDGHGGADVAEHCKNTIPNIFKKEYKPEVNIKEMFKKIFQKVDQELVMVGASDQGTCCCVVLIRNEQNKKVCYVANLGDTRGVLNLNGEAKRKTIDHKASNKDEIKRIEKCGGRVIRNRVSGQLAVTRALGDLDLKTEGVICEPDVDWFEIDEQCKFLIIASDGLFDVVEDQKAVDLVKNETDTQVMSKILVEFAVNNGSRDNTSVMVIKF